MNKNKILTAAELEKQARETQADAAHIRNKAAKERKIIAQREIKQGPARAKA